MANVLEAKLAELEKENKRLQAMRDGDLDMLAKMRARCSALEDRCRRLEESIVGMVLESYAGGQ